jgi:hypothetical protein
MTMAQMQERVTQFRRRPFSGSRRAVLLVLTANNSLRDGDDSAPTRHVARNRGSESRGNFFMNESAIPRSENS